MRAVGGDQGGEGNIYGFGLTATSIIMVLPAGYTVTIKLEGVEIHHEGHIGIEGDLIFASDNLNDRRPSIWQSDMNDEEIQVTRMVMKTCFNQDGGFIF